jgi:hypothetical protein
MGFEIEKLKELILQVNMSIVLSGIEYKLLFHKMPYYACWGVTASIILSEADHAEGGVKKFSLDPS